MNAIVIADKNWAIGRDNGLLFSLPTDMKRFRELTTGCTVLMGHRTLDSFPGGQPLKGRQNIVLTRDPTFRREGVTAVTSLDAALEAVDDPDRLWVIGGGSVYTALLSRCKRVYLTRVDADAGETDTFFPNLDKLPGWEVEHAGEPMMENGLTFRFIEYINKNI